MMTYSEYLQYWIKKHENADWTTDTSPMDQSGKYTKYWNFSDNFQIIAVNRPIWREATATVMVEGIPVTIKQDIKLFQTEIWNTEDATSQFFYELF